MSDLGFWRLAEQDPDPLALVEPDGRRRSRGELLAASNRVVHGLRGLGLEAGDAVAAVLPNGGPVLELYLAATQAGLYLVPVNHHLTAPEIAYILRDSEAKAFVGAERFAEACRGAAEEAGIAPERCFALGSVPGFRPYAELGADAPPTAPGARATGALMNYTSGTTGRPKGVRRPLPALDPDTVATLYTGFLGLFGIRPEEGNVHLVASPLYHTAVLVFAGCSLHMGHALVVMDKWDAERSLALIERHRVTTTHMVPTQFHRLLQLPEETRARYDVSSLRHAVHAAAPCPVSLKRRMLEWWGDVIYEYYAATEGGGTLATPEEWRAHPGTVGRAWPGADVRVLDDEGRPCAPGEAGTVYMKLGSADFEYHGDPEKTRKNRRDGYFTVGDVGWLDDEGYLYLCDRASDMIISGGVNIYPAEIEGVLLEHPAVADVAVFGVPHEDWGEAVKAVVEPAPGRSGDPTLTDELLAFCRERLARFKTPRSVDYVDAMPRDPNGKLYKRRLRDPYWEGRERAI